MEIALKLKGSLRKLSNKITLFAVRIKLLDVIEFLLGPSFFFLFDFTNLMALLFVLPLGLLGMSQSATL